MTKPTKLYNLAAYDCA